VKSAENVHPRLELRWIYNAFVTIANLRQHTIVSNWRRFVSRLAGESVSSLPGMAACEVSDRHISAYDHLPTKTSTSQLRSTKRQIDAADFVWD
jgi:hypothetical protein